MATEDYPKFQVGKEWGITEIDSGISIPAPHLPEKF